MRTVCSVTDDSSLGGSAGLAASPCFPVSACFASFGGSCAVALTAWPEIISNAAIALRLRNFFIISLRNLFFWLPADRTYKRQSNRLRVFIHPCNGHWLRIDSSRQWLRGFAPPHGRRAPRRQIFPRGYRVVRRFEQSELIRAVSELLGRW